MQFIKNPDKVKYNEALEKIRDNRGYRLDCTEYTIENLCPCKKFIESNEKGECYCGRYVKIEV